jgi:hypothetical protein
MPSFEVRFIKTVPDDTGHDHYVCQAHLMLEAQSDTDACERGVAAFCRDRHLDDWTTHADVIEVRVLQTA